MRQVRCGDGGRVEVLQRVWRFTGSREVLELPERVETGAKFCEECGTKVG